MKGETNYKSTEGMKLGSRQFTNQERRINAQQLREGDI